ncbi:replication protein A 70 kDa DNA-binding subunit B [Tanacetum coccineum]
MDTFVAGYINDLSAVKDNITLRVRILRTWMQQVYRKQHIKNLELIIMDEHNTKMQATVRMTLVNQLKDQLEEGSVVILERYSLGEIKPKYRMVNKALRLSFLSNTKVEPCTDFNGSLYGFDFRGYRSITSLQQEEDGQFDVIGHVVACEDLGNYDKNGKSGKKKPLTLVDHEGNELKCTLWSAFVQQFNDFLNTCSDHEKIIVVLQLAMMKIWDVVLFDGMHPIVKEEFQAVKEYSIRLFAIEDGITSIIVGTIIAMYEDEGWWYIGYRSCKKKVIREKDMIDLEADIPKKNASCKDDWWCTKCNDESGTMSLTLWNDEVQAVVDRSAYQLCDKYGKICMKVEQNDQLSSEITALIGKKYAFKVSIDEYKVKKLLPVFIVLRLSDDPEILDSICMNVTPSKMDTEATSSALPNITSLDLESQTDENTTPVITKKNNAMDHVEKEDSSDGKNKRPAENDIGNKSSNGKKKAIKVKTEKDA